MHAPESAARTSMQKERPSHVAVSVLSLTRSMQTPVAGSSASAGCSVSSTASWSSTTSYVSWKRSPTSSALRTLQNKQRRALDNEEQPSSTLANAHTPWSARGGRPRAAPPPRRRRSGTRTPARATRTRGTAVDRHNTHTHTNGRRSAITPSHTHPDSDTGRQTPRASSGGGDSDDSGDSPRASCLSPLPPAKPALTIEVSPRLPSALSYPVAAAVLSGHGTSTACSSRLWSSSAGVTRPRTAPTRCSRAASRATSRRSPVPNGE